MAQERLFPHEDPTSWTNDDWATPFEFVRSLEMEFGPFELDPCCTAETAKAPLFYTKGENGLTKPWAPLRVFCNPPYTEKAAFLEKAIEESRQGALVVCLVPANVQDRWFHELVLGKAEIRFLRGFYFNAIGKEGRTKPRDGCLLAIYRPRLTDLERGTFERSFSTDNEV